MSEETEREAPSPGGAGAAPGPPRERERPQRKGGGDAGPDPDAWMVTFSDLLTLMMTFFVLIFASQDPVKEKIQEAFGQSAGVFGLFRTSIMDVIRPVPRQDISQDRLQIFLTQIGAVDIDVKQDETGLVVTLPTDAYFAPNSARLNDRGIKRVDQLAKYLRFTKHNIRVEGHTDNQETGAPDFSDPWSLSIGRANAVLELLLRNRIDARRLSLVGYGPSRPRFTNVSRLGRARNRRVEIVIVNRAPQAGGVGPGGGP